MFQFSCRFACYHVIVSQTAYWKWRVHAVRFGQLLGAPFLAGLETQIFVNNPRNWWSMDPPPHVKFLWLFSGSDVCLPNSAITTQQCQRINSSVRVLRLPLPGRLSTVPNFTSRLWCCSSSNIYTKTLLWLPSVVTFTFIQIFDQNFVFFT